MTHSTTSSGTGRVPKPERCCAVRCLRRPGRGVAVLSPTVDATKLPSTSKIVAWKLLWSAAYVPLFLLAVASLSFGGGDESSKPPRRRFFGQLLTWAGSRAVGIAHGDSTFGGRYCRLMVTEGKPPSLVGYSGKVLSPVRVVAAVQRRRWTVMEIELPGARHAHYVVNTDLLPDSLRPTPAGQAAGAR